MSDTARHDLYNGMGNGMSRAFELAATPAAFAAMGYGIDRLLGWVPVFTIVFFVFAVVGMGLRAWYAYDHKMSAIEAERGWSTAPGTNRGTAA